MKRQTQFDVISLYEVPVSGPIAVPDRIAPAMARPAILVVDDERIIADTLAQIFNQSGYSAVPAYNASMALELASQVAPDLLVTDVAMPGMSGIDLAITLQQQCPQCKVILFSGQASTVDLLASARAAGHTFQTLSKPVHPAVMLGQVSQLLPSQRSPLLA